MTLIQTRPLILSLLLTAFSTIQAQAQTFTLLSSAFVPHHAMGPELPVNNPVFLNVAFDGVTVFLLAGMVLLLLVLVVIVIRLNRKNNELKQLGDKFKKIDQKNAAKDKFFSIIAHDLKSPFNSLMGLSEMLVLHSETMNQTEVLNYSKMVHQSTGKLFALVENLLQWSRTQMGTTDYKPEKLDLNILTGNVVNLLRLSAQEKDIVIALKMENDLLSYADANIYSTVLRNLVGNAIKFSRVGSIIHVVGKKRSSGMIEIEVSDSGVGMNSEQLEKAFKIESAQSTVGTFNEKGTGLGLILSKEFVELNKGAIDISSRIGEGTTVRFTVPSISMAAN